VTEHNHEKHHSRQMVSELVIFCTAKHFRWNRIWHHYSADVTGRIAMGIST